MLVIQGDPVYGQERAQAELHYGLSKWIMIDLIRKQLLTETEAARILQNLMETLGPPTS